MHYNYYLLIITLIINLSGGKISPGVWVDDGNGNTIKAELPPGEAKLLRKHMMEVLGLPAPLHRRKHFKSEGSAPIFLKSIYDALDERGHAPHLDTHYRTTVDAADVIITFVNKNSKLNGLRGSHRRLWFDVSDVSLEDSLLGAELRIYRSSAMTKIASEDLILHIYLSNKEKSEDRAIAKGILPKKGWMSFNITAAMLQWIIFTDRNYGLRIGVTRPNHKHELHLTEVGIRSGHDNEKFRPFIVGFFAEPHEKELVHSNRVIRSTSLKSDYTNPIKSMSRNMESTRSILAENRCQKRNLYVSFRDLGWQEWVIAPEGYNADFCDGRCQFPMLANMNATNHAIIQTLVKMKRAINDGDGIPPDACCAPRDLTTISVLYIDYSGNIVLKKYPKMIVKNCGCI